jgi:hypothetical protein
MGQYSDFYCKDDNSQLRVIVDTIIRRNFNWLPQCEYDDFYSIAGQTVWYCEMRFDPDRNDSFEKYLVDSLIRKFKSRVTYLNRRKRRGDQPDISLDAFVSNEEQLRNLDFIAAKQDEEIHPVTQRYLDSLTKIQRRIAELIMLGYDIKSIKQILNLSDKRFYMIFCRMKNDSKTERLNKIRRIEHER